LLLREEEVEETAETRSEREKTVSELIMSKIEFEWSMFFSFLLN